MTFGLLSAGQLALLATLTGGAVLVIFFLKVRHPRIEVPSLVLWRRVLEDERRDSLIERLRRILSLLLALAIALLLAFALSEPQRSGLSEGRIALIVDNSATMAAGADGGGTRLEQALEEARGIVDGAPGARFQIADTAGTVLTAPGLDRPAAREALARIRAQFTDPRLPSVAEGYTPTVITDGRGVTVPEGMARVAIPSATGNVGITAFEIRPSSSNPQESQAYLAIVNFDQRPQQVAITIRGRGQVVARRSVELAAGSRLNDVFPMQDLEAGPVEVRLEHDPDAFTLDDVAYGWLADRRPVRVTLVGDQTPALERVLATNPRLDAWRIAAMDYRPGIDTDVLVFDGVTPTEAPTRPALLFGVEARPWLESSAPGEIPEDALLVASPHALMDGLPLADIRARRARAFADGTGTPIATIAGRPVIAAGRTTAPWIAVGFPLDLSNLVAQPAFPIFVSNAINWLGEEPDPVAAHLGLVHLTAADARIISPEGDVVPALSGPSGTEFLADHPGIYFAEHGGGRQAIAVNLANATVSTRASATPDGNESDVLPNGGHSPLWVTLGALALFLLVLEWWTWQRRITV
ncbi:MAG: VWA domain-containing protein [Vicinamibacterales bacterium]